MNWARSLRTGYTSGFAQHTARPLALVPTGDPGSLIDCAGQSVSPGEPQLRTMRMRVTSPSPRLACFAN